VELEALGQEDFIRILTEPDNALVKQYIALLATEEVTIEFIRDAVEEVAGIAAVVNDKTENIGARRLHTILEKLLEDISFHAPERKGDRITIDRDYVQDKLGEIVKDEDLSRYIL
jgi:ATP-dependent HslUV protease ATP-binding subunit HslU